MKNAIVEMILNLLVSQAGAGFEWLESELESNDVEYDEYILDVVCYSSTHSYMQNKLRALAASTTETKIDDKLVDEWLEFAELHLDPDMSMEDAKERAEELGFAGLIK